MAGQGSSTGRIVLFADGGFTDRVFALVFTFGLSF